MSVMIFVTSLGAAGLFGYIMYQRGLIDGHKQGYAICVAEEDDDSVRVRKF